MRDENPTPMGGSGKVVEVDETYYGPKAKLLPRPDQKTRTKRAVVALVERNGSVRSFHVKGHPTIADVREIVVRNASRASTIHTDESRLYVQIGTEFAKHETVRHSALEYARGDVHTNTIEGFFSIFKRGMRGVYQHCAEKHLHRYLTEFDFRYNNRIARGIGDDERTVRAIKGAEGKRLTYRQPAVGAN
jgi:hypothetical protein